jgi:hypothetical protein
MEDCTYLNDISKGERRVLPDQGSFITCAVLKNPEKNEMELKK